MTISTRKSRFRRERNRRLALLESSRDPSSPRNDFIVRCRKHLSRAQAELLAFRNGGIGGKDFVSTYSGIVDEIAKVLFKRASLDNGFAPEETGIAVVAIGGYGRSELAPYSDVDILILCKRKTPKVKKIASMFVRLMWDVGFELGHSVQSLVESRNTLAKNMDMRTALIEGRWVCGSREMERIARTLLPQSRKDREIFLQRKIKDVLQRHAKYGKSYQLVEPNVKLSPGGMRDFQTLMWLGMASAENKEKGLQSLKEMGLLLPGEVKELREAYDFLLKTRVELHLATHSKQDQLTVKMQKIITERLSYGSRGDHLGVELFMKDYYLHTRTIFRILEDVVGELDRGRDVAALLGGKKRLEDGHVLDLRISQSRIRENPLYVFYLQKQKGINLSRSLRRRLERTLHTLLTGSAATGKLRRSFMGLLANDKNLTLVLRSMHETGFLSRVIPEYGGLTCLKRYDLYHHYTADEHSFRVVKNLEELSASRASKLSSLSRIYSEIADKQLLFLSALLHDIGKIEGRGHARKGAKLSQKILKRLGVGEESRSFIGFLIEHHLLMSHFSQRRDPTDIGTIRSFCARVRNRTNLKFLTLLTYADLKATSPQVWTKWKFNLLWKLYLIARQFLAKKEKKPDAVYKARKKAILRAFLKGGERERALAHLNLLPGRYLLTMSPSQVRRQMKLLEELDGKKAVVDVKCRKPPTEITFCTFDQPFRLSQLCGVLAVNDLNILSAYAFTRKDGKVIDVFSVENLAGSGAVNEKRRDKIQGDLLKVLGGEINLDEEFSRHLTRWKRRKNTAIPIPLRVEFDNELSPDFTIIDIFAQDEPGLLYKITRALSKLGLVIYRARISTEANRAIDAFYVQERDKSKIKSARRIAQVRRGLERALS